MYDIRCMVCTGERLLDWHLLFAAQMHVLQHAFDTLSQMLMYTLAYKVEMLTGSHGVIGIASHTLYCYQQCAFPVNCTEGKRFLRKLPYGG